MKPHDDEVAYEIEQGMVDPRTKAILWTTFDVAANFPAAEAIVHKTFNSTSLWRIRESKNVSVSRRYQALQKEKGP